MKKNKTLRLFLILFLLPTLVFSGCFSGQNPTYNIAYAEGGTFEVGLNPNRDYLILVNGTHEYDFNGVYNTELLADIIYVSDCYGEPTPIEKGANTAFSLLKQYLRDNCGVDIELYSAYRTKSDQQWVYDNFGNLEGWSEENKVAKPGFSEHHTGLLLSIVVWWPSEENPNEYVWTTETAERQANEPGFAVIHESLADFGFIDRYPDHKKHTTGILNEPYEIRFVGSSQIAHEIMDNGLCLEEYLAKLSK